MKKHNCPHNFDSEGFAILLEGKCENHFVTRKPADNYAKYVQRVNEGKNVEVIEI